MVFLRPTILTESTDISSLSNEKYNFIKAEKLLKDPDSKPLIDLTVE
jgi:type II secretory pathway component GspD/PulD (secretin)